MATGQNTQGQYDALTREISDTTVKLNQLQQTQAQTNQALLAASGSTTAFQTGLQGISNAAMNVASKTAMISAAAGMALDAIRRIVRIQELRANPTPAAVAAAVVRFHRNADPVATAEAAW